MKKYFHNISASDNFILHGQLHFPFHTCECASDLNQFLIIRYLNEIHDKYIIPGKNNIN